MKNNTVFGLVAGFLVGTAATVAGAVTADKISREMKSNIAARDFVSPEGDRIVTLTFGSSATVKGLTGIKVKAYTVGEERACEMILFAKKREGFMSGKWTDNDHFTLLVGTGRRKQCCEISFDADHITANYYAAKEA